MCFFFALVFSISYFVSFYIYDTWFDSLPTTHTHGASQMLQREQQCVVYNPRRPAPTNCINKKYHRPSLPIFSFDSRRLEFILLLLIYPFRFVLHNNIRTRILGLVFCARRILVHAPHTYMVAAFGKRACKKNSFRVGGHCFRGIFAPPSPPYPLSGNVMS